jgi:hypothetical protein
MEVNISKSWLLSSVKPWGAEGCSRRVPHEGRLKVEGCSRRVPRRGRFREHQSAFFQPLFGTHA